MAIKKMYCLVALDPSKVKGGSTFYQIVFPKDRPEYFYLQKEDAIGYANELAIHNPKIPVILFESCDLFETKKPEIIRKVFQENGDLVPK